MSAHDYVDNDPDFNAFLQDLIDNGHIVGPAVAVIKRVIAEGISCLDVKQRRIFDTHVGEFILSECSRGSCDIPWQEMAEAHDRGGVCRWCAQIDTDD